MSDAYDAACEVRDGYNHLAQEVERLNQHLCALNVMVRVFLEWHLVSGKPLEGTAPGLKKSLLALLEQLLSIEELAKSRNER